MNTFERLQKLLKDKNVPHQILDSNTDSLDLDEQIQALNMKYREGMGTLLFTTDDGRYIALLRRDDRSVDLKKFRQILKVDTLEMCDIFSLQRLGFESGLLAPLLLDDRVEIFIDRATLEMKKMICGAGDARHALVIKKEDLLKNLHSYKEIDVTFPNPFRQDADNVQIRRVLSGITPSGNALHIGNYFGAVKPQMDLQEKVEKSFYFVADMHALTTIQDKERLEDNIANNVLDFIALGLDPEKSAYFRQSDVPAHCQLMVVLGNYIPFGLMKRMHAFKDKLEKGATVDSINMGLFNYPILMAADILLYKPDGVPVGEDQRQHVELTRDVAQYFNNAYNQGFFPLPEALIQSSYAGKVVGTDGERKMSKSLGNVIGIFEDEEVIKKQIMSCYTDPKRIKATDPGTVEGNPVFVYHDLINEDKEEVNDLKNRYRKGRVGDVEVKEKLFEAHKKRFAKAREKRKEIENNIDLAKDILRSGAKSASEFANVTLEEVYDVIGMKNNLSVLFGE
ncbi:tryptophan--tRNA ligase [Candidatus Dojkabacteria bacterium]|nr:tryptophan--tRNA ligase [Candidatus Dojkabacteria bacterium]